MDQELKESLENCSKLVAAKLEEILPDDFSSSKIVKAMRYSCLSDGKRIRPFLLMKCAELFGAPNISSLNAATAIELIHTYSLIHDDLPAMDNDDYRRGKLSNHKMFDEATAILAGDAILTLAFELLSDKSTHINPTIRCQLIKLAASSSGYRGMIGGQMMDIENIDNQLTKEQIANLHRLKTGELFMASCEMGAIIANASIEDRNKIRFFAHDLGLAFQIKDDILDHKDSDHHKIKLDISNRHQEPKEDNSSIVELIGLDNANKQLDLLIKQAKDHVASYSNQASTLVKICDFIKNRDS